MPTFDQSSSDLPTMDKEGNAITEMNPLELEDVLVRQIERSDAVLGRPTSGVLENFTDSPVNWAMLGLFLRDIFLNGKIQELAEALETGLANVNPDIPNATMAVRGIIEIANQAERRSGRDNSRAMTAEGVLDQLQNGSNIAATATRRGVIEIANQAERRSGRDNSRAMTSEGVLDQLRNGLDVSATTSRRGTVQLGNQSEAEAAQENSKPLTSLRVGQSIEANAVTGDINSVDVLTQAEYDALARPDANIAYFIVG